MNQAQFRWLLVALAGVMVGYVIVRRRRQLVESLPQPLVEQAERFVIPWTSLDRTNEAAPGNERDEADTQSLAGTADEPEEPESETSSRRKVSATYRISYGGRRYGPLPASLVGEYVEIENSNGKLFVLHAGTPIATFDLTAE